MISTQYESEHSHCNSELQHSKPETCQQLASKAFAEIWEVLTGLELVQFLLQFDIRHIYLVTLFAQVVIRSLLAHVLLPINI